MTDFRKFCLGVFAGMAGTATLQNSGLWGTPPNGASPAETIIAMGLLCGCLAVMWLGREKRV